MFSLLLYYRGDVCTYVSTEYDFSLLYFRGDGRESSTMAYISFFINPQTTERRRIYVYDVVFFFLLFFAKQIKKKNKKTQQRQLKLAKP